MEKSGGVQSTRRTATIASLKVGRDFLYQAAGWGRTAAPGTAINPCAQTVISEYNPSSAGVVRRIARSDHCRCVSTPRCSRTSWKVVSIRQRNTKRLRIATGSRSRSVQRNAWGSRTPEGSRTRTQRIGAGGRPLEYQTEVPETYSSLPVCPPYHSAIVTWVQTVMG